MNIKLINQISFSLLMARWRQTLVAAVGVTFSITMFITLLSFMTGLNDLLDGLIINRVPHIRLYTEIKPSDLQPIDRSFKFNSTYNFIESIKPKNEKLEIRNSLPILKSLSLDGRVLSSCGRVTAPVFYNIGSTDVTGIVNGIDVVAENSLFYFRDYVVEGNSLDLMNIPNSIILGKGLAEKMLANIGDIVQITTSTGERSKLKVVGFYQSGLLDVDKVQSYCSIVKIEQ